MSLVLGVNSAEIPENLECVVSNPNWQSLIALLSVILPDGFKLNLGNTTPAAGDRIWPWLRSEADGTPDRLYIYSGGFWLSRHTTPPGLIQLWEGDIANVATLDGGDADPPDTSHGPFWERVTELDGRIPIQPGNLITSGDAIAVNTNYGADEQTLNDDNYKHHRHYTSALAAVSGNAEPNASTYVATNGGGVGNENYILQRTSTEANVGLTSRVNGAPDVPNEAFSQLNPVRGMWFLRRTSRLFYRQAA